MSGMWNDRFDIYGRPIGFGAGQQMGEMAPFPELQGTEPTTSGDVPVPQFVNMTEQQMRRRVEEDGGAPRRPIKVEPEYEEPLHQCEGCVLKNERIKRMEEESKLSMNDSKQEVDRLKEENEALKERLARYENPALPASPTIGIIAGPSTLASSSAGGNRVGVGAANGARDFYSQFFYPPLPQVPQAPPAPPLPPAAVRAPRAPRAPSASLTPVAASSAPSLSPQFGPMRRQKRQTRKPKETRLNELFHDPAYRAIADQFFWNPHDPAPLSPKRVRKLETCKPLYQLIEKGARKTWDTLNDDDHAEWLSQRRCWMMFQKEQKEAGLIFF